VNCPHGYDGNQQASVDEEERSSCCGAFVTFGDGGLMCKCCFALISGGEEVEGTEVYARP